MREVHTYFYIVNKRSLLQNKWHGIKSNSQALKAHEGITKIETVASKRAMCSHTRTNDRVSFIEKKSETSYSKQVII